MKSRPIAGVFTTVNIPIDIDVKCGGFCNTVDENGETIKYKFKTLQMLELKIDDLLSHRQSGALFKVIDINKNEYTLKGLSDDRDTKVTYDILKRSVWKLQKI